MNSAGIVLVALLMLNAGHSEAGHVQRLYELSINGTKHAIVEGQSLDVRTAEGDVQIQLADLRRVRVSLDKLRFEIPGHYADSIDRTGGVTSLTLDGNDVVVTVNSLGSTDLADEIIAGLNGDLKARGEVEIARGRIGDRETVKILGEIGGIPLSFELLKVPHEDGTSYLIIVQDSLDDERQHSSGYGQVVDAIGKTLVIAE